MHYKMQQLFHDLCMETHEFSNTYELVRWMDAGEMLCFSSGVPTNLESTDG